MSDVEQKSSSKHKHKHRSKDKDRERTDKTDRKKKRPKRDDAASARDDDDDGRRSHKHRKKDKDSKGSKIDKRKGPKVVDDDGDEDMWVEKDITMDGEHQLGADIPTAESLALKSNPTNPAPAVSLPPSMATESKFKRDDWMLEPQPKVVTVDSSTSRTAKLMETLDQSLTEDYGEAEVNKRTLGGGVDYFSELGTDRKKKAREDKPDPEKLQVSSRELNTQLREGKSLDEYTTFAPKAQTPGGPGSQWRMTKLRRTYETAEEEGRGIEVVALERYGNMEAFQEAVEEKRILDERASRRAGRSGGGSAGPGSGREQDRGRGQPDHGREERFMFNDLGAFSRSSSQASFKRPGQDSGPPTPQPVQSRKDLPSDQTGPPANRRLDALRGPGGRTPGDSTPNHSKPSTPIPSVMAPNIPSRSRALSPSSMNKLQAKVLRAKLMNQPDADALEKQYEEELKRSQGVSTGGDEESSGRRVEVAVLPTLDGRGKLYDVGQGKDDGKIMPGNRKKKEHFETRDPKTGELVRYNADDDDVTLGEMLRQERFGAGMADQKDLDAELAGAIMGDGKFQDDLEYMDDNAEKLGRKKMRTDAMKRQFAIQDYARTQKALSSCLHCYGEDDTPPKAAVIAMGTRAYLACTQFDELVDGHCYIVPIQHHLSMLEGDDDVWEEVKNFMKTLIQMFADQEKGVIFYETVLSLKWQKHTFIECVPVPYDIFQDLPAYFKESILASEAEWSQHKKLIDFSARPGGFRRAMVPNLPYFMVQWDHKGEKGYGHVIEGTGDAAGGGEGDGAVDEGDKGGGDFPRYFAAEIIGNVLDVEPRRWRRPRKIDTRLNKERVARFRTKYAKYDWTPMIQRS